MSDRVKPEFDAIATVPSRDAGKLRPRRLLYLLLLAGVATLALAHSPQQAPPQAPPQASQDVTRSLHAGSAAQVVRSTQEAGQAAKDARDAEQAAQDATRGVSAQVAIDAATQAGPGMDRGILFRITAPVATAGAVAASTGSRSNPTVGYLFGTIHFGSPEEQGLDYGKLGQLLNGVTVYANEADVDSHWDTRLDAYRWLPIKTPLSGMIGVAALAQAKELLPDVQQRDLQRMRPWMVLALLEARGEHGGDNSADIRLQRIASGMGKRLVHLETLEAQLKALDCVPPVQHARVLQERLNKPLYLQMDSAESMASYRARDLGAWLADVDRMEGLSDAAKQIEQRSRLCLLEDRNAKWIATIESLYREAPTLVAVGALHLMGQNGLIARLRHDGFLVEVVPM